MDPVATNRTLTTPPIGDMDVGPWWKQGYLWFILAGPAVVAVAAIVTMGIAIHSPDPLVSASYYKDGLDINRTLRAKGSAELPAELGRNHAATPARSLSESQSRP